VKSANNQSARGVSPRRPVPSRIARAAGSLFGACLLATGVARAQPPTVIEVQAGDTFSGIAARFTGQARDWRKLYDRRSSGLPNPNRIQPGMRFELISEASGRRYLRLTGASESNPPAAASPAPAVAAPQPPAQAAIAAGVPTLPAAAETLVVGVLPNIGAAALMAQYDSLKSYLERMNPQKVRIVLPASFKVFYDSTMRGDYDLAVAAPHFARVAQVDGRMQPLALYEPRIAGQFITLGDGAVAAPGDVRGKSVAFANPQSLVAMYGRQWLQQQNLEAGKDYEVKPARTDMGVGRMLLTNEVAAAIMSNGEFRGLPPEESSRLKILEVFARIPNFVVLGHPRLGTERLANLKSQLLSFLSDPQDGSAFSKATGITGIVEADEAQLRELDAFVAPTRRAMGGGN